MGTSVVVLLCVLLIQGVISLIFNYIFYFQGSKGLSPINKRIQSFNKYVYDHMYKGTGLGNVLTTFNFYKPLSEVQSNPITQKSAQKSALSVLPKDITAESLAKAFFTVNMHSHFHKLGLRNPSTQRALSLFDPLSLLIPSLFSPADYLFKRGTFIDDISDKLGNPNAGFLDTEILQNGTVVNNAIALNAEWIAEANNRGNNIYAEDANIPFFIMATMMMMVQIVIIGVMYYILQDPRRREALVEILAPNRS